MSSVKKSPVSLGTFVDVFGEPKKVYLTPTGVRLNGPRSLVLPVQEALGQLPKGQARKLRKALRGAGRGDFAGAKRTSNNQQLYRFVGAVS